MIIGGDVGVTNVKGKADFKKNSVLDPYRITAKNINVQTPSAVNNRTFSPATGGPNPTFFPYNGNTTGLSNITVSTSTTLNGNWKDVTVKKGITATITGNNFGKISIEEGAVVTFTASVINLQELKIEKGKKNVNVLTIVNFANPASVKVKDKVTIEDDTRVNVGGPKVTFYAGDNTGGDEKFEVKGENSQVTANIMVPVGKLHVHGGNDISRPIIMTGWYIIEKLDGHGKYVYWNKYDCSNPAPSMQFVNKVEEIKNPIVIAPAPVEPKASKELFKANVYPNPSAVEFTLQVISSSNEPIWVRIIDMNGVVRSLNKVLSKTNIIKVGASLASGTYIAEVSQGKNKQVIKLVKLN
jgi:Secretion system C-terminal sorting domain